LVEGILDRVAIRRLVPDKAVLARLSKGVGRQMVHSLRRQVSRIWVAFDMDDAGNKGLEQVRQLFEPDVEVIRLVYPAKDPANLLEKYGMRAADNLTRQIEAFR